MILSLAQHLLNFVECALHTVPTKPSSGRACYLWQCGMGVFKQDVKIPTQPLLYTTGRFLDAPHTEPLLFLLPGKFHRVTTLHALSSRAAESPIRLEGNGSLKFTNATVLRFLNRLIFLG